MGPTPDTIPCAYPDCQNQAVVGWANAKGWTFTVWLCATHFDTWLDRAEDTFIVRTAP